MKQSVATVKIAEIELLIGSAIAGFLLASVTYVGHIAGSSMYEHLFEDNLHLVVLLVFGSIIVVPTYLYERLTWLELKRILKSGRLDLLISAAVGAYVALQIAASFQLGNRIENLDVAWGVSFYLLTTIGLGSATVRATGRAKLSRHERVSFLPDDELKSVNNDQLKSSDQAKSFADLVAKESAIGGLVFGIDGPWGVGKSSFVNFAQIEWDKNEEIIVFRFEPIKYLGEGDLVRSFIRELSGRIRIDHFAPELRPLASKYARMIKAEPGFSIPGVRLSIDSNASTVDEIVADVDEVLRRNGRRAIIVLDDLDRVEFEVMNRVLFMIHRSRLASNITYVLVYDTERIIKGSGDQSTREYLEKFINAKVSLFADLRDLAEYLRGGWRSALSSDDKSIGSARVLGLQSILSNLADLLEGSTGGNYVGMVGNIRKIKRLINAMLLLGIERIELHQTDFNRTDLINLLVLHLNFPGVFREIYSNEGEGRTGIFSVESSGGFYANSAKFSEYAAGLCRDSEYLVKQLFDVGVIGIDKDKATRGQLISLACFNSPGRRNLANYLDLIVRFVVPDPLTTEVVYESILNQVALGSEVSVEIEKSVLHEKFSAQVKLLAAFASSANQFSRDAKEQMIDFIVENLPKFSSVGSPSDRSNCIYSLAIITNSIFDGLDHASPKFQHSAAQLQELVVGNGDASLINRLGAVGRGLQGIHDVMLLRLLCCADRGNQLRNIHLALAREHIYAKPAMQSGRAKQENIFVIDGVRLISQKSFQIFKERYIDSGANVFIECWKESSNEDFVTAPLVKWGGVAGFISYQLSNSLPPTGSGVGCGFYDVKGDSDKQGIAEIMNTYLFGLCFSSDQDETMMVFADYCLSNFSRDYFDDEGIGAVPTRESLEQGLDPARFKRFWLDNHERFKLRRLDRLERVVETANYRASYAEHLRQVWDTLDAAYLNAGADADADANANANVNVNVNAVIANGIAVERGN
jgi:hypothetical protein